MNECILVVDDDPEIVRAIAILLEKEGYQVLKAYNGMEALEQAINPALRLIIIDVMMPRLDGLSAVMKIREKRNLGQGARPVHGGGRLHRQALPSPGAGGPGAQPAPALYPTG